MVNYADIIIIILVLGLLYLCLRNILPDKKTGMSSCSCGGNCANCALGCIHATGNKKI